jgi:tyrosyl-tRNA synthetase
MDVRQKIKLITRNMAEVVTKDELTALLKKKKHPTVYLGTAITGKPHIGYFAWILKLADFLNAGCSVTVLLADLHGALDNCPWDLLEKRYKYYNTIIPLMFKAIGVSTKQLKIIKGSEFQLKKDYMFDVLKMSTYASINDCKRAAAEVVKFGDNPKLSGLLYPIMQALDEEYLDVDIQYGGLDQRKILMFAREFLPKLGYNQRVEFMTPIIPGLVGKKMSASDVKSKIDLLDDEETVNNKVHGAYCEPGSVEDNGILGFAQYVVFTLKTDNNKAFVIERPEKYGGSLSYKTYGKLERDYINKKIHPLDLKSTIAKEINTLLAPIREKQKELSKLAKAAFTQE